MRAITVHPSSPNSVELREVPEPPRHEGAILADAIALGVCGTDREIIAGDYGQAPEGEERLILGHELLGRVREAPPEFGLEVGDHIVGIVRERDPVPCPACANGNWDMCRNGQYTEHGIKGLNGFGAQRWRIDPDYAVKIDPSLGLTAVLMEPTSVVAKVWDHAHRLWRLADTPHRVLVTGAGPIGLLAALLGKQRGLDVHVYDHNKIGPKPEITAALGATYHCESVEALEKLQPDIIIECTGVPSVIATLPPQVAPDALICLTGVGASRKQEFDIGLFNRNMVLNNGVVFGSVNANLRHYQMAADALAHADRAWLARLITRRVPLARFAEAFDGRKGDIKVVIEFAEEWVSDTSRIEDYALIGDCQSAALVSRDGSIDWLCWPRFDSDACFAALLGSKDHGRFRIAPQGEIKKVTRRYRPGTLILETRFETDDGAVMLTDFMPIRGKNPDCVRIVTGERGRVAMCVEMVLRFGYGASVPWVRKLGDGTLRAIAGPDMVVLRTPVHLRGENMTTVGEFVVAQGDRVPFVLSYGPSHLPVPQAFAADAALQDTESFWEEWCRRGKVTGPWREAVLRSLITLKALTYGPTGGMVAAPTTSLPEHIGGDRNWDYRFCWVRDATLTLLALMNAGYYEEAQCWRDWLTRAVAGRPEQLGVMYGVAGERRLAEWEVDWLPGYQASRPVRIGNAAHTQLQLDVFGEVMDTLHQGRRGGLPSSESGWDVQIALLDHLAKIWREPDHGIWEVRTAPMHFTYSKAMTWVAFDRAIKSSEMFGLPGDIARWRKLCGEIHADVCRRGWNAKRNSFTRCYGSDDLDASLLLLAPIGFLKPDDPRYRGTVEAIERDLVVDGLVLRYDSLKSKDGLPPGEGAFLACSFWLADAYLLLGRREDAERLFGRLVALCNDVGLLSEEYDPRAQRQLGNFPQAFSHVALINTAFNLTRADKPAEQRSELPKGTTKEAQATATA